MRLTTPLKSVLAGCAALALLTACGGGSDDTSSSSSGSSSSATSTSSSAAETSADLDAESAAFCADTVSAFDELTTAFTNAGTDPTTLPALVAQASERLNGITPPDEISSQWTEFTSALSTASAGIQGLDLSTPEGQQQFTAVFSQLQTSGAQAQTELQDYLTTTCGIEPGATAGPASPTS
ncbi:hypothetical protein SAMN03159343_1639 [Klenkia marina]|uniref:Lipoprotein n=1 Tax=Klenkia marina TaxID=1960309 RepID=A0A1G4XWT2_9ACTN|nr:hypothetical protein [Klenkia marina]SCX45652.1 hypothetical protein SAMN03159343_1639 [Klenkia marina]